MGPKPIKQDKLTKIKKFSFSFMKPIWLKNIQQPFVDVRGSKQAKKTCHTAPCCRCDGTDGDVRVIWVSEWVSEEVCHSDVAFRN